MSWVDERLGVVRLGRSGDVVRTCVMGEAGMGVSTVGLVPLSKVSVVFSCRIPAATNRSSFAARICSLELACPLSCCVLDGLSVNSLSQPPRQFLSELIRDFPFNEYIPEGDAVLGLLAMAAPRCPYGIVSAASMDLHRWA